MKHNKYNFRNILEKSNIITEKNSEKMRYEVMYSLTINLNFYFIES